VWLLFTGIKIMDWYLVLTSAIAGGVGGGIYGVILAKWKDNKKAHFIAVLLGLSCFFGLKTTFKTDAVREALMSQVDPQYVAKSRYLKKAEAIFEIDSVREKLESFKTTAESKAYAASLVHNGLKRLAYKDLKEWNRLRLLMANGSNELCAGFWSGKLIEEVLFNTLLSFSEKDGDSWIKMSANAAKAESNEKKYTAATQEDFQVSLGKILSTKEKKDSQKAGIILATGVNVENEDACWIMKLIMSSAKDLDDVSRESYLRYLASL
jgi:hypothetical protein